MKSCIYEGTVRHRRSAPVHHAFRYSIFMMYLDLAELPDLFRGRWLWSPHIPNVAWLKQSDHLGDPQIPLDRNVRDLVEAKTGHRPAGPIRLLTHLRYFGYGFNPVSFYFCFDISDRLVETIVAEVTNTPWGEQHCYVLGESLNEGIGRRHRYRFAKQFHVSPFIGMDVDYDWRFSSPAGQLAMHMENLRNGTCFFDVTTVLRRQEITGASLARVLVQYPLMTLRVIGAIHWQALRLWLKRCPVFSHPKPHRHSVRAGRMSG
ncbi:MAG: DUF1365 domain-containing protein [Nitrospirota bacterium]|nr:DUF1365 domain-containing protein [Nitrospirota bacterium]